MNVSLTAGTPVGYKRPVSVSNDLKRVGEALAAFAIAPLPEPVKRTERFAFFLSPAAHVASGMVEIAMCAGLFINGMIGYVQAFNAGPGLVYLQSRPSLDYGDFFGMGALAYLSYLVRPTSLLLVYCFGEGIARAVQAAVWEGTPGVALLAVPWRLAMRLRRTAQRAHTAALLGPQRPDEIVPAEASRSRLFEVYSVEDKPWSEYQVVEHEGRFFQLATRRLVPRGAHHAFRYQFHPLEDREIIRGTIVKLAAAASEPPGAPPPQGDSTH
jgi:hypothetical protein